MRHSPHDISGRTVSGIAGSQEHRVLNKSKTARVTASGKSSSGSLIAGVIAGITASACCLGPLVLLMLGISGSWISNLTALEPYRPIFIGVTLMFLGLVFRKLYLVPQHCANDAPCAQSVNLRKQRIVFWLVTGVVSLMVAFPWYGALFIK